MRSSQWVFFFHRYCSYFCSGRFPGIQSQNLISVHLFSGIKCSEGLLFDFWERAKGIYSWDYSPDTRMCCWGLWHAQSQPFCICLHIREDNCLNYIKILSGYFFGTGVKFFCGLCIKLSTVPSYLFILVFFSFSFEFVILPLALCWFPEGLYSLLSSVTPLSYTFCAGYSVSWKLCFTLFDL